jgi:DNA segregation ATPase FtsK/SpoIIIE, S-DNA-T family
MRWNILERRMGQATRYGQLTFTDHVERALREGSLWTLMCASIYLALSLISYSPQDPGWSYIGNDPQVANAGGRTGAWFADAALYLFGYLAYLLPFMIAWSAWLLFRWRGDEAEAKTWLLSLRWVGFLVTIAAGCGFASVNLAVEGDYLPNGAGGGFGLLVSGRMLEAFGLVGANLLLLGALFVSLTLFFSFSWLKLIDATGAVALQGPEPPLAVLDPFDPRSVRASAGSALVRRTLPGGPAACAQPDRSGRGPVHAGGDATSGAHTTSAETSAARGPGTADRSAIRVRGLRSAVQAAGAPSAEGAPSGRGVTRSRFRPA